MAASEDALGATFGSGSAGVDGGRTSFVLENDYLDDSDDGYTGGPLVRRTSPGQRSRDRMVRTGAAVGQMLSTPSDLAPSVPARDRARAGWLFLSASRSVARGPHERLVAASVGVVGPSSGGAGLQRRLHRAVGGAPR